MDTLVLLAIVGIIVWYFGGAIKSVLEGASAMASEEFTQVQADQIVNNIQRDQRRTQKYNDLVNNNSNTIKAKDLINAYRETSSKED